MNAAPSTAPHDAALLASLSISIGDIGDRAAVTARDVHRCVESATHAFLRRLGLANAEEGPIALRSTVSLQRPLANGADAMLRMHATKVGTTSLEARYTLTGADGGSIARADVLLVWLNAAREAVVPLPEAVRDAVLAVASEAPVQVARPLFAQAA